MRYCKVCSRGYNAFIVARQTVPKEPEKMICVSKPVFVPNAARTTTLQLEVDNKLEDIFGYSDEDDPSEDDHEPDDEDWDDDYDDYEEEDDGYDSYEDEDEDDWEDDYEDDDDWDDDYDDYDYDDYDDDDEEIPVDDDLDAVG